MTIRVLLADDERLVRTGFRMILRDEPGIEVVAEAADGTEAVTLAAQVRPDVVLMDIRMPNLNGIEATRRIVATPDAPRVLVLTTFDHDKYVFDALAAGASGFLLKDAPEQQLLAAIRVVAGGGGLFAPSVTRRVIEQFALLAEPKEPPPGLAQLTAREVEVLKLIAQAKTNAEIGASLFIGEHTARTHVARILAKLNLNDRTQAAVLAYECRLVQPGSH
jgi:DNA-binding NarL/FixJ family response regulator